MKLFLLIVIIATILFCSGCSQQPQPLFASPSSTSEEIHPSHFDEKKTGSIKGIVYWKDTFPEDKDQLCPNRSSGVGVLVESRPNPNFPTIARDGRVTHAVLFLRGIDPSLAKPFSITVPSVVMTDEAIQFTNALSLDKKIGLMQVQQTLTMTSLQNQFHALRARGATTFTRMFPEPHRSLSYKMEKTGLVEFSSGAGYFWTRAYLFVDSHPYYVCSNEQGTFELTQVPEGEYELVAWLPNWKISRHERDTESGKISRVFFETPHERSRTVRVHAQQTTEVLMEMGTKK